MSKPKLVIFGTGDIARLACHYFTSDAGYEVAGFTVDAAYLRGDRFEGRGVVPFEDIAATFPPGDFHLFVAISYTRMNALRAERYERAKALGYAVPSYVSSRAHVLTRRGIGENCFILEGVIVQPFVSIGHNVTIWSGTHIGHDSSVGDHCFLAPCVAVSGNVRIGSHCFIGINATVRNSISLAPRTLVGAGAVVMADTEEGSVHVAPRAQRRDIRSDQVQL